MDLRSIACFVAVAEELHFRRAAQRLNLTQPSLSQRIRSLEQEVGTALFARDRRGVSLTSAGLAFLDPARQAMNNATVAKARALKAARGEFGRIKLGFTLIAFYGLLPEAVRLFRGRYPDIDVDLVELNSPSLEHALVLGELDLAILHPPLSAPNLIVRALSDEPLMLALPVAHPLAQRPRIRIDELRNMPFLLAPRSVGPDFHDRLLRYFQTHGFSPRIVQEVTPMTTLTGLVAAGVGMGFVTAGVARVPRPGVTFRTVSPVPPRLPMAAAWGAPELSASGRLFLKLVDDLYGKAGTSRRRQERDASRSPLRPRSRTG